MLIGVHIGSQPPAIVAIFEIFSHDGVLSKMQNYKKIAFGGRCLLLMVLPILKTTFGYFRLLTPSLFRLLFLLIRPFSLLFMLPADITLPVSSFPISSFPTSS